MNVLFEERPSLHGFRIGIATLDAEKSLNALSLPMIEALAAKLDAWAEDAGIACVLLRGNGAKAFCAGGDVRKLVDACREQPGEVPALARRFFADEYRLDYRIHTYPKPFICWAHGYVMGGGMGLMQGAGIRIVTPSSRLAMPEIGIGLYPDVGASWFLARLPGRLGLFLGLSAAQMNARDALDLDLADRFLLDDQQDALLAGLVQMNWNESPQVQLHSLLRALEHEARGELPEAQLLPRRPRLDALLDQPDLASAWQALCAARRRRPAACAWREDPGRGLPDDRASGLAADRACALPVAGRGVPPGIRHEPELHAPSGLRRGGTRKADRSRQRTELALAAGGIDPAGGDRGALRADLGGRASAGGALIRRAALCRRRARARHVHSV